MVRFVIYLSFVGSVACLVYYLLHKIEFPQLMMICFAYFHLTIRLYGMCAIWLVGAMPIDICHWHACYVHASNNSLLFLFIYYFFVCNW